MAVFSRLLPCIACTYGVQALLGAIFVPLQEDRFYDLSGTFGFLSTTFISLYYPALRARVPLPPLRSFAPRQLLLTAALGIWSARLGSFLVERALKAGGDSRFDEVKKQPSKFAIFWVAQATWIMVVGLPVYLVNNLPPVLHPKLGWFDYAAAGLYVGSLLFEIVADRQKSAWRKAKGEGKHNEKFISSGLWGLSRHPNYVGEVGIWTGIWAMSLSSLRMGYFAPYIPGIALASPLLTYFLLTKLSGVPPLEASAEKKWGDDPQWKAYKSKVPVFFPWMRAS